MSRVTESIPVMALMNLNWFITPVFSTTSPLRISSKLFKSFSVPIMKTLSPTIWNFNFNSIKPAIVSSWPISVPTGIAKVTYDIDPSVDVPLASMPMRSEDISCCPLLRESFVPTIMA